MAVENLARVRFVMAEEGPTPVFQGFHRGEYGMAGAIVYVTESTLRAMVDWHNAQSNDFDRIHNRMFGEEEILAFGGSTADATVILAPDGITPLYMVSTYEPLIVQRFDPTRGRTYAVKSGEQTVAMKPYGEWVNVAPYEGDPEPVGFVVDEQGWREGRTDTPPIGEAPESGPYFDHDGKRTEDPHCELGLCVECIDYVIDSGKSVTPALSVADPRFATDPDYRARVVEALRTVGVTLREAEPVA